MSRLLITILLAMFPYFHTPAQRACVVAHADEIAAQADASAAAYHVPPGILISTAFLETHLGCDRGESGGWGSPIDRRHRHVAGTSDSAARDLAHNYARCGGTWLAAIRGYRSGLCNREPPAGYTAEQALRLFERLRLRAGIDAPEHLRR